MGNRIPFVSGSELRRERRRLPGKDLKDPALLPISMATFRSRICFLVIAALLLPSRAAWADGVAFDRSGFTPMTFGEQRAAIRFADGRQRMVIALNNLDFGKQPDHRGALWIFPVPGDPKTVKLDVVNKFPIFSGRDIRADVSRRIGGLFGLATFPLLVPVPLNVIIIPYFISYKRASGLRSEMLQQVDKFGIHAELIRADSLDGVAAHLTAKGVPVDKSRLKSFDAYLSEKYSLVLVWIASSKEFAAEFRTEDRGTWQIPGSHPCVYVEFPAERGFYPLRATSAYGDRPIRVTLSVVGFVSVDLSGIKDAESLPKVLPYRIGNKNGIEQGYYWRPIFSHESALSKTAPSGFAEGIVEDKLEYTRIRMQVPASLFVGDLSFTTTPPDHALRLKRIAEFFPEDGPVYYVLLAFVWAMFSSVSGWAAGLIVFGDRRKYWLLGLWSFLTTVAVWIAVRRVRQRMGQPTKALRFVTVFSLVYFVLFLGAWIGSLWLLGA